MMGVHACDVSTRLGQEPDFGGAFDSRPPSDGGVTIQTLAKHLPFRLIWDQLVGPGHSHLQILEMKIFGPSQKNGFNYSWDIGAPAGFFFFTTHPSSANIIPACLSLSQTINLYQGS